MNNIINEKQILRKHFQALRSSLSKQEVELQSQKICQNFIENLFYKLPNIQNKNFALYQNAFNEVDTNILKQFFIINEIQFSYPRIKHSNNLIDFIKYQEHQEFKYNLDYKKIYEPLNGIIIIPDFIITPLLAFDHNLMRLGMGKGYYDRTIAKLKTINSKIKTIGLAFDFQESQSFLNAQKHDQALDFIVTTTKIFSLN
jgi:5-formyltetrahydrofolate cyclo-ligase